MRAPSKRNGESSGALVSRGRGAPLANHGPNSFAYAILIFWLLVQAGTPPVRYRGTYGTVLYQYSLDLFYPGI